MLLQVTAIPTDQFFTEPVGVPIFSDLTPPRREGGRINFRLRGLISSWLQQGIIDSFSATPLLFSPGCGNTFPLILIAGAGPFHELSAPAIERVLARMTESLLQSQSFLFALAVRDFRRAHTPLRDEAEIILRGLTHGAELAGITSGHTIRLHWDQLDADLLVQELRRARHHLPTTRGWTIERHPIDAEWMALV